VIKASALLAAGAIGLLVAGVLASSLQMVYVSIAVCAVAALILAAGILTHWTELFGRAEPQPASVPESWSAPQAQVRTPVLASAQAAATAGRAERRARRDDAGGRPPAGPVEVAPAQAGLPVPGRGDELWDRVEEELGSAGKRDTGALSWPGIDLPVLADPPATAGPAEMAVPQGPPPAGTKAWIWGQRPGWQPPGTPDPSWPPPAAAFAGAAAPPGRAAPDAGRAGPDRAGPDRAGPDRAGPDRAGEEHPGAGTPDRAGSAAADGGPAAGEPAGPEPEATAAEPAPDAEGAAPDSPGDDSAGAAHGEEATGPAAEHEDEQADAIPDRPQWIITLPGRESPAADHPRQPDKAGSGDQAAADEDAAAVEPAAEEPGSGEPAAGGPAAEEAAAQEPAAEKPAAEEPAAGGPASETGPGRAEVTVVPGVARYHRSECILIRFLGAGDLEIMTRQEAEVAKFVPCRACQPDQLAG
jgi:hypothetical protein